MASVMAVSSCSASAVMPVMASISPGSDPAAVGAQDAP